MKAEGRRRMAGLSGTFKALTLAISLCLAIHGLACADELPVIADSDAGAHVGQMAIVEGLVAEVYVSKKGDVFLNFEAPYPNEVFSGVIFAGSAPAFDDPGSYQGKQVRLSGSIRLYRGKPEIVLETPSQIRVMP
jgi:hypothetical protein